MRGEATSITLDLPGLEIPDTDRALWEKQVAEMAQAAESLAGLDPMAEEPMNIFDPSFAEGGAL